MSSRFSGAARGLARLSEHDPRHRFNDTTRAYFERMAALETGPVAADMKAVAKDPPDLAAARLAAKIALLQFPHANHLRSPANRGRACQQRIAADGFGGHQLPSVSGRYG